MLGDRLAQIGDAEHRRILVHAIAQIIYADLDHIVGTVAVGESLAEIDCIVLLGKTRHDFEYRRTETGKNTVAGFHGAFPVVDRRIYYHTAEPVHQRPA